MHMGSLCQIAVQRLTEFGFWYLFLGTDDYNINVSSLNFKHCTVSLMPYQKKNKIIPNQYKHLRMINVNCSVGR